MHRPDSIARDDEARPTGAGDTSEAATAPGVRPAQVPSAEQESTLYSAAWVHNPVISYAPRAKPAADESESAIGGRYEIEALTRRGPVSDTYAARHRVLGKKVVIEVLRPEHASDPDIAAQFLGEAKTASLVQNAHFVDVLDFGRLADGGLYSILERLEGVSLATLATPGNTMPEDRLLSIARQIADGLAAAHAANVFHGDLTLDQVLLVTHEGQAGFVKLRALGRAAGAASESRFKASAKVGQETVFEKNETGYESHPIETEPVAEAKPSGTNHEAREDLNPSLRRELDRGMQSDIESFGGIVYRLASGLEPLRGKDSHPIPLRALAAAPQIAPGIEAIMLTALTRRSSEQRYRNMQEIVVDLQKFSEGGVPDALLEMIARSPSIVLVERRPPKPEPAPPAPARALKISLPPAHLPLPWSTYAAFVALLVLSGLTVGVLFRAWFGSATSTTAPTHSAPSREAPLAPASGHGSLGVTPVK